MEGAVRVPVVLRGSPTGSPVSPSRSADFVPVSAASAASGGVLDASGTRYVCVYSLIMCLCAFCMRVCACMFASVYWLPLILFIA